MAAVSLPTISPSIVEMRAEWAVDRKPISRVLSNEIGLSKERKNGLPSPLVDIIVDFIREGSEVFGETEWTTHFGPVPPAPALPEDIEQYLQRPCPIFPGESVGKTHRLVYLPASVREIPLTLKIFSELIDPYLPKIGFGFCHPSITRKLDDEPIEPGWVFMTNRIVPDSLNKRCTVQYAMVTELAHRTQTAYKIPNALEAAVCIGTSYCKSLIKKGSFNGSQSIWTSCQETERTGEGHVVAGGLMENSFYLDRSSGEDPDVGIAAILRIQKDSLPS